MQTDAPGRECANCTCELMPLGCEFACELNPSCCELIPQHYQISSTHFYLIIKMKSKWASNFIEVYIIYTTTYVCKQRIVALLLMEFLSKMRKMQTIRVNYLVTVHFYHIIFFKKLLLGGYLQRSCFKCLNC